MEYIHEHVAHEEQDHGLDEDGQHHGGGTVDPVLHQVQGQMLVPVEAVGGADQGGPDQYVA